MVTRSWLTDNEGDMATGDAAEESVSLRELRDGIYYWRNRTRWPADLHNAEYEAWARQNPNGNFTIEWWERHQLPKLSRPSSRSDSGHPGNHHGRLGHDQRVPCRQPPRLQGKP